MQQPSKLDKGKVSLVTQHPFWASLLLNRKVVITDQVPLAGVDQRARLYVNPQGIEQLTVPQVVHLLAHEVGHVMFLHAARAGNRNLKLWNKACDAVINDILVDAGVGDPIEGGVYIPGSRHKTAEDVYGEMMRDQPDGPRGPSDDGDGDAGDGPGGIGNDLIDDGEPMTEEEQAQQDAEIKVQIAQAAQAAKMQGKLSGALAELVAAILQPPTPWYDILERYMTAFTAQDYTWARPNRRFEQYLPSTGKLPRMGEVVIQVDVSGSITPKELGYYDGHLKRIVELCSPERVHVLYTDTAVCKHEVFEVDEEFGLTHYAGGGTDMEAGFEFVDREGISPEVFVCLTDGCTTFNESARPSYPVVWCISTPGITAPYGDTVHVDHSQ